MPHQLVCMTGGQLLEGLGDQFQQRLSKQFAQKGLPFVLRAVFEQLEGKDRPEGPGEYLYVGQNDVRDVRSFCGQSRKKKVGRESHDSKFSAQGNHIVVTAYSNLSVQRNCPGPPSCVRRPLGASCMPEMDGTAP